MFVGVCARNDGETDHSVAESAVCEWCERIDEHGRRRAAADRGAALHARRRRDRRLAPPPARGLCPSRSLSLPPCRSPRGLASFACLLTFLTCAPVQALHRVLETSRASLGVQGASVSRRSAPCFVNEPRNQQNPQKQRRDDGTIELEEFSVVDSDTVRNEATPSAAAMPTVEVVAAAYNSLFASA